jgi:hypothetical protein
MQRLLTILILFSYASAAIAVPLLVALDAKFNAPLTFAHVCSCGCDGNQQKCVCDQTRNILTFTPCSTANNNVLLPDIPLSVALVDDPVGMSDADPRSSLYYAMTDDDTLPGIAVLIDHPPRI